MTFQIGSGGAFLLNLKPSLHRRCRAGCHRASDRRHVNSGETASPGDEVGQFADVFVFKILVQEFHERPDALREDLRNVSRRAASVRQILVLPRHVDVVVRTADITAI